MDVVPVLYLSHGAPTLLDDERWKAELSALAGRLPRPRAILVVSAHWETPVATLSATRPVPLVYDFFGFEQRFYQLTYKAPPAPGLVGRVRALLTAAGIAVAGDEERGLDHGAWVPLMVMYPEADIPVVQLSMPTLEPSTLLVLGEALAPLASEGVLVMGSGFFTHNLREMRWSEGFDATPPAWSVEFDHWGAERLAAGDVDALLDFARKAPAASVAHPRTEHFAPLFVSLGAGGTRVRTEIEGFWYGLAKRSFSAIGE
jgi:4,5-DOPA dioxygenase extradiol